MSNKDLFLLLVQTRCIVKDVRDGRGLAVQTVYAASKIDVEKVQIDYEISIDSMAENYVEAQYYNRGGDNPYHQKWMWKF